MEYKFRKNSGLGQWCTILLPLCLLALVFSSSGDLYFILFSFCLWFCIFDCLKCITSLQSALSSYSNSYLCTIISIPISIFTWKYFIHCSCFFHAFALTFFMMWCYNYFNVVLLKNCPGSFTLGEAQILAQSIMLFLLSCEFSFFKKITTTTYLSNLTYDFRHVKCLQVLLLGSFLFMYFLYIFPSLRRGVNFLSLCCIASVLMLISWSICLHKNIFEWLLVFCLRDMKRIHLILFWIFCTFISILFVVLVNMSSVSSGSTLIRKVFHFVITAVYVPGIIFDLELLRLASGITFAIFLMLEVGRIIKLPFFAPMIENAFQIFLDEKDTGFLILTHIYLLIGCSCPVWLHGYQSDMKELHISLFSGILSVGIGDTVAAVCGKSFGKHKWKGSNKTLEGSGSSFVVQIIFAFFFSYLTGHSLTSKTVILLTTAVILTTYLEAKTDQVDNLVLPLFMFSILCWI